MMRAIVLVAAVPAAGCYRSTVPTAHPRTSPSCGTRRQVPATSIVFLESLSTLDARAERVLLGASALPAER